MTNDLVELEGTVAKIIYYNKQNGYRIADFRMYEIDGFVRIVNKFGLQTIDIIKNDIDRLKEFEGVGPKTIEAIQKGYPG
jgi:hypothetical protein